MTKIWQQVLVCPTCGAKESLPVQRLTAPPPAKVVCDTCRAKAATT